MRFSIWRIVFICLSCFLLFSVEGRTIRLGLVVGHNRGLDDDPRLQFAESDAQKIAELFQEVGGMDEDRVILLKSPRPEELENAFKEIHTWSMQAMPNDEVVFIFYFSGHGTGEYLKLGRRKFTLKELKERIDEIPAKLRIGILDACQSGAITRLKGARLVQPFVLEQQLKSQGSILIASSAENESSQESDQLQGSFFTHYLISALRGAGDVSGDRRVSLLEAYQYAYQKTLLETEESQGGAQHAKAQLNLDVEGDVVLTDLNSGRGGLIFKPEVEGEILIANSYSQIVGEFQKTKGKEAFWALPPGTYRIFQKLGRKTMQFKTKIKDKQIKSIEPGDLTSGFQFSGLAKGRDAANDIPLPWKIQDWPTQFPFELGIGWINSFFQTSFIGHVGVRVHPAFGGFISYTMNKTHERRLFDSKNYQELKLGMQSGKFLTQNIECLGTIFHKLDRFQDLGDQYFSGQCGTDSQSLNSCQGVIRGDAPKWHFDGGTGVTVGLRFWIWNRLSFEINYGSEYNWRESNYNPTNLILMPAFHF